MKKLRTACVALSLMFALTFATVPTVMANGDDPQGTTKSPGPAPAPPPPPPDPIIIEIILIILGL
ncbi:MAG: hypothetical protein M3430_19675 [Acidobacteriota bacterium]|nr:hypothetical protein [Acidobacteriota bacterium]